VAAASQKDSFVLTFYFSLAAANVICGSASYWLAKGQMKYAFR